MSEGDAGELVRLAFAKQAPAFSAMGPVGPNLSAEDREDTFHEALLALRDAAMRTGPVVDSWDSWLFGVCRNKAAAVIRRNILENEGRGELEDAEPDSFEDPTFDAALATDPKAELGRHLRNLDPMYRVPLEMKLGGATYDEIAETLGLATATVRQRACRGRLKLWQQFTAEG